MAKARDIPGIDRDMPYATAAARVVAVRADEVVEHARGVLDIGEIERVHDMRVATRRLRAALEVFRPCFPRDEFKDALREVKAIADALGERRDRDVTIAALEDFGEALAAPDRPGIESLVAKLRTRAGRGERGSRRLRRRGAPRGAARAPRLAGGGGRGRPASRPAPVSVNGGDPVRGAG